VSQHHPHRGCCPPVLLAPVVSASAWLVLTRLWPLVLPALLVLYAVLLCCLCSTGVPCEVQA